MDRFKLLLEKGYFPSQLPPAFTTEQFARWRRSLVSTISPNWSVGVKEGERFSQARTGHRRRPLAITHPVSQLMISQQIATNWQTIKKHQRSSKLSVSKTNFVENDPRATSLTRLAELRSLRLRKSAGFRFILKSDVLQYFPTIYTHAIPWALHGKPNAKKNKKYGQNELLGNNLDYWIRSGQSGQTIGIPIGPDTSHIVAETLGASIDASLKAALKKWPEGYRHVDDFFLCFESSEEAAKALAAIVRALDQFELQINPDKTAIVAVADYKDEDWVHRLDGMQISTESEKSQRNSIVDYFEKVFELTREFDNESVVNYALKKSANFVVFEPNWSLFESYLARIAVVYPNNLETVCSVLVTYFSMSYQLDRAIVERIVNSTISRHAPLNHHSEVAWALWLAKECQIKLKREAVLCLTAMRSSVCALIALDLEMQGLLKSPMNKEYWRDQCTADGLNGVHWLFAYENDVKGWVNPKQSGYVAQDPFFSELRKKNISFYDGSRTVQPLIVRERIEGPDEELLADAFDVVFGGYGYEVSEAAEEYMD
jgi:hypothetical protein